MAAAALPQFRRHDPGISLALDIADEYRPLDDGRYDIAIRHCPAPGPDLCAVPLFPLELTPYVSCNLVKKEPAALDRGACAPSADSGGGLGRLVPRRRRRPPARGRRGQLLVRNQHLILEAVLAGEGAGLLTPRFAEAHVASGRLFRPFRQTITTGAYYLAWHEDREDDPLIATFRDWIVAILGDQADAHVSYW